ncbi:MAG: cysteine peptidase family C39 domain-containing protein, partial [Nitrospirota bacterium]
MPADVGNGSPPSDSSQSSAVAEAPDTGLICLLILARYYDLPADGSQLRHQFAESGRALSDTELLRAAKHLGLKAGTLNTSWNTLAGTPFPAMAKRTDGRYVVLAKIDGDKAL